MDTALREEGNFLTFNQGAKKDQSKGPTSYAKLT
jgi:hypothetical protein